MLALLLLGLSAIVPAWRTLWFAATGDVVEGVVVRQDEVLRGEWEERSGTQERGGPAVGTARLLLRALVEFEDDGRVHRVEARAMAPSAIYPVGSKVVVVYPRGRPERAQLRPELPDPWLQAGWLLAGTFLVGWAVYWWWLTVRRPRRVRVVKGGV